MLYINPDDGAMKNTITIEITNQKAFGILHELEELNLIRVVKGDLIPVTRLKMF